MNLSDKKINMGTDFNPPYWLYPEEDVKEFIKELKENIGMWETIQCHKVCEEIDKLAGDKLI